jgi:hypothetical protein
VIGNSLAAAAVAKFEDDLGQAKEESPETAIPVAARA